MSGRFKAVHGEIWSDHLKPEHNFEVDLSDPRLKAEFTLIFQYGKMTLHRGSCIPELDRCARAFLEKLAHTPINRKTFGSVASELEWRLQREAEWL